MKYNYVIFSNHGDLYHYAYSDVIGLENVRYLDKPFGECGKIVSFIHRLHKSRVVNKILNLPFKNIWNKFYFINDFSNNKPICFLFGTDQSYYIQEYKLFEYLKKRYPNSKFVWFLSDILSSREERYDVARLRNSFDLIISFDHKDCEKYGFIYHPLVFSSYKGVINNMPETDIYFLGQAKDRLSQILSVYEKLKEANLKCDFYITGVEEKDQAYSNEIVYNQRLNYSQNLQHVLHTKCLLEVMQKNGYGYTQRVVEILGLNKKLLTNNPSIKSAPFYDPKYISTFNSSDDINLDFLEHIKDREIFDYHYKEKISPKSFLEFIEQHLN